MTGLQHYFPYKGTYRLHATRQTTMNCQTSSLRRGLSHIIVSRTRRPHPAEVLLSPAALWNR
jgi:hypothetical protein